MPSWRVGGPNQSQPARLQLDTADSKFLENTVYATCCLEDIQVFVASTKASLISEGRLQV